MTHNTRTIALERMRYPAFVEYDGQIYRAWKPMRLAKVEGIVLVATDTSGQQRGLLYANGERATVEVIIG